MTNTRRDPLSVTYARSLKLRGMDGPIDNYLYRPIGFLIAWLASFTRLTPNAITLISVALGIGAGLTALSGSFQGFLACALLLQAANCFDCADGQLARMTGQGTPEGRIIDGIGDTLTNICVFLCAILGLVRGGRSAGATVALVAFAGFAKVFSCMFYDRAITRYAERMMGDGNADPRDEIEDSRARALRSRGPRRALWQIYSGYLRAQELGKDLARQRGRASALAVAEEGKPAYQAAMLPLLSLWSFSGPSAHALYFLVFAAVGRIQLYFETSIVLAALTCVCLALEQLVELRMRPHLEVAPVAQASRDDRRSR